MKTPSDTLRAALLAAKKRDISQYDIMLETGVHQSTITRFLEGAEIKTKTFDALCVCLGLELKPKQ